MVIAVGHLGIAILFLAERFQEGREDRQRVTLYSWNRNPGSRKDNLVYGFTIPGLGLCFQELICKSSFIQEITGLLFGFTNLFLEEEINV